MRAPPISSARVTSPITISAIRGELGVHRGVALDHEHHVAEAGDVGTTGGGRAEQAADLGHPARQPHLVAVKRPPRGASGNRSTWSVMRAPAESTNQNTGSSWRRACSVSRTIFSTVRRPTSRP